MDYMNETKDYTFRRINKTVKIGRVTAHEFLSSAQSNVPFPVLALVKMSEAERAELLKKITFPEYLDYAQTANTFNGNLPDEETEKK